MDDKNSANKLNAKQSEQIIDFVCTDAHIPLIIYEAGVTSCAGAISKVLNWYLNCYLRDNYSEYRSFRIFNPNIVRDVCVCKLLLKELQNRHGSLKSMLNTIRLRRKRKNLLDTFQGLYAAKIYQQHPQMMKWLKKLNCISFSEKVISGNPEVIRFACCQFLHSGCGITQYKGNILVTEINENCRMQEIFEKMLKIVTPETYSIKGENYEDFFTPFENHFKLSAYRNNRYFLELLKNSPKDAVIYLLADTQFKSANIYGKAGISICAEKFDSLI